MGTPTWIQWTEYTHGVNTEGYDDIFNRANRVIWDNFTAEHKKDGTHKDFSSITFWEMETGEYTGNATDDRDIILTNTNLDVKYVRIYSEAVGYSVYKMESIAGDNALQGPASSFTANLIQSVGTGTFQVGDSALVNDSGTVYHWVAFGPEV